MRNEEDDDQFQVGIFFVPNDVHVPDALHVTGPRGVDRRGEGRVVGVVLRRRTGDDQDEDRARVRVPAGVPPGTMVLYTT